MGNSHGVTALAPLGQPQQLADAKAAAEKEAVKASLKMAQQKLAATAAETAAVEASLKMAQQKLAATEAEKAAAEKAAAEKTEIAKLMAELEIKKANLAMSKTEAEGDDDAGIPSKTEIAKLMAELEIKKANLAMSKTEAEGDDDAGIPSYMIVIILFIVFVVVILSISIFNRNETPRNRTPSVLLKKQNTKRRNS